MVFDPQSRPQASQSAFDSSRRGSGGMTGDDVEEPCKWLGASALRMRSRFKHQEHAAGPKSKASSATHPDRCEVILEIEAATFVEHQHFLALAVVRGANQGNLTLSGGDLR